MKKYLLIMLATIIGCACSSDVKCPITSTGRSFNITTENGKLGVVVDCSSPNKSGYTRDIDQIECYHLISNVCRNGYTLLKNDENYFMIAECK